jgi:outer membrane protein assembly factor BamB
MGPSVPALSGPRVAWNTSVDADVYASPLIVNGHVIVATENNTVYSLDVFTGTVVWMNHLGDPVDARSLPCGNIGPVTGITGTPVVDPATGRVYVVAFLRSHHHMLFALSLVDGKIVSQQDVDPSGSNPLVQQQRGALSIGSGFVYIPLGGLYGDCGAYHGYVVGVPMVGGGARFYRIPSGEGAGIWTPQGATIAADGSVYVVSGNATGGSGFGYSNSVIQLTPDLSTVTSYFAPSNWAALNASDTDLGSVGATLLPGGLVMAIGKQGVAYVLRAGSLGGVGGELASRRVCAGAWGGTAWIEPATVFVPCADGLFALGVSASSIQIEWFVGRPSLGSPIVAAGAVWAIDSTSATLYALDPLDGRHVLFTANLGASSHFATLAATDGFVVAPAGQKVVAISVVS